MVPPPARYGLPRNFRGQTETKRMCFAGDCETVVAKAVRYAPGGAERKACPLAVTMPGGAALQVHCLGALPASKSPRCR